MEGIFQPTADLFRALTQMSPQYKYLYHLHLNVKKQMELYSSGAADKCIWMSTSSRDAVSCLGPFDPAALAS